jgi:hypothetical protein
VTGGTDLALYLDDCADHGNLVRLLTSAGYRVVTPREAGTKGARDPDHLAYAAAHGHVLLTLNPDDFRDLHGQWQAAGLAHAGIFLVYQENDVKRDMQHADIVRAIGKSLASGLPIENECHVLNQWR